MKRRFLSKFLVFTILAAILAVSGFCAAGYFSLGGAELPDVSYFSTERFQEPDGTVATVFASGDQYYNYLHDRKGRILVPDGDGFLRYAESKNGRPVATATRWNADAGTVTRTDTMTAADLDLEKNPDLLNKFGSLGASTDMAKLVANFKRNSPRRTDAEMPSNGKEQAKKTPEKNEAFYGTTVPNTAKESNPSARPNEKTQSNPSEQADVFARPTGVVPSVDGSQPYRSSRSGGAGKSDFSLRNVGASDDGSIPAKVVNNVIFLRFPDESDRIVTEGVLQTLSNEEGRQQTLNDYFESVSANAFGFYNVLPYRADGSIFVYTAPKPISFYRRVASSGIARQVEEGALLGGALQAAKPYLEEEIAKCGFSTDGDGDGAVDSVTFLVLSDEPGNDAWSTLLWPHQWSFDTVFVSETLGNAKADRYLFMFTSSTRFFPVLTHEIGHVVGAPDLYHYSGKYVPVGYYDNMASSSGLYPNFWLTAMREKYLADAVSPWQVSEIKENWDGYTLKATSSGGQNQLLAYKIKISESEWIYLEYRQPDIGRYDKNFDCGTDSSAESGLVVYRVKEGVFGNIEAKAPGIGYYSSPDEIYVYRNLDISKAALNEKNPSIGSARDVKSYQDGNLYLTNGRNSGIVVTVKEIDRASATVRFEVYNKNFPDYSGVESLVGLSVSSRTESTESLRLSALYGENLKFDVYPVYQKGSSRILGEEPIPMDIFELSGYNAFDTSLKEQSVSARFDCEKAMAAGFLIAEGAIFPTLSFTVNVQDYDVRIEIISLTNREFLVGTIDGFVADWKIVTAMGKTSAAYNLSSPQTKLLRYEISDGAEESSKTVRVVYGKLLATVTAKFYDKAVAVRYVGDASFSYGSDVRTFHFEIANLSGTKREISVDAAEIGFSAERLGAQELRFSYGDLNLSFTVYVYKNATSYRLLKNGEETPKEEEISLRYGESIDFSQYVLAVRFENESSETKLALVGRIAPKIYTYDVKVTATFPEAYRNGKPVAVVFRVFVDLKNDRELLSSTDKNVIIDYKNQLIVLKSFFTPTELEQKLSTAEHLSATVLRSETNHTFVELTNRANGIALENFRFKVVLKGDANGDGTTDAADVKALAELYLEEDSAYRNAVGDKNGDGKFTLVDFTLWLRFLQGEESGNA